MEFRDHWVEGVGFRGARVSAKVRPPSRKPLAPHTYLCAVGSLLNIFHEATSPDSKP